MNNFEYIRVIEPTSDEIEALNDYGSGCVARAGKDIWLLAQSDDSEIWGVDAGIEDATHIWIFLGMIYQARTQWRSTLEIIARGVGARVLDGRHVDGLLIELPEGEELRQALADTIDAISEWYAQQV